MQVEVLSGWHVGRFCSRALQVQGLERKLMKSLILRDDAWTGGAYVRLAAEPLSSI